MLSSRTDDVSAFSGLHPSFISVAAYRLSRHLHLTGRMLAARLVAHLGSLLTGAEISPAADIGPGLVLVSPAGSVLYGKAGRNLTVMGCCGTGGELGPRLDVGGGPGLPVLGDDVVIEPHGGVFGACRVGHRVRITAGAVVVRDVPDDMIVEGPRLRLRSRLDTA